MPFKSPTDDFEVRQALEVFGRTAQDLEANLAGQLSADQIRRLQMRALPEIVFIGIWFVMGGMIVSRHSFGLDVPDPTRLPHIVLLIFLAVWLLILWYLGSRLGLIVQTLRSPEIAETLGSFRKRKEKDDYLLVMGDEEQLRFKVARQTYDAIDSGTPFRVFYLPHIPQELLSLHYNPPQELIFNTPAPRVTPQSWVWQPKKYLLVWFDEGLDEATQPDRDHN